jgi:hypothetical protein
MELIISSPAPVPLQAFFGSFSGSGAGSDGLRVPFEIPFEGAKSIKNRSVGIGIFAHPLPFLFLPPPGQMLQFFIHILNMEPLFLVRILY